MIVPVILCGGGGTRLWPLSRNSYPKQLLPLVSKNTMLQDTILRNWDLLGIEKPIVICNEVHRFLVAEQLQEINIQHPVLILEPVGRNTAPAVTVAALHSRAQGIDPLLLVLPADHVIKNQDAYFEAICKASMIAEADHLVTFGVTPSRAETGYGYIKKGAALASGFQVESFVEKPNLVLAQQYLESNEYLWNSGMFLLRASLFLAEMQQHAPDILFQCEEAYADMQQDQDFLRLNKAAFLACRSDSIDYAVFEKSKKIAVVPLDADWSDVGSWSSLAEVKNADVNGNVIEGDVSLDNVTGSFVHASHRMLAVVGVHDHIIVETADAVLVAHKDYSQNVKNIVNELKNNNRTEVDIHRRVYRPWGYYEVLDGAKEYLVKRIMVKPGGRLSLQAHNNRSEHWVVLAGVATVTRAEEVVLLHENQSTYIPKGVKHRLENGSNKPLIIIEVQCGSYISEDDIIRYEDVYGRSEVVF